MRCRKTSELPRASADAKWYESRLTGYVFARIERPLSGKADITPGTLEIEPVMDHFTADSIIYGTSTLIPMAMKLAIPSGSSSRAPRFF